MKVNKIAAILAAGALCMSALTGCGDHVNANATIATLGDKEIKAGVVTFICHYQQALYEDYYTSVLGENPWSADPYSSGQTMLESLKESTMESLQEMYTVYEHMDDYGISLSDEEKAAISTAADKFLADNDKATLEAMGANKDVVEEMLTLYTVRQKMYDRIIADADTNVTDAEANMRAYTVLRVNISGTYDSSYNYTAYTDEEKATMKADLEAFVATVTNPADLETLAEAASYTTSTATYDADDDLDEALRTALDGLKVGEMSAVVESDYYLYVVRIDSDHDEEATESNRKSIVQTRQDDLYKGILEGWEEELTWTVDEELLADIQFNSILTAPASTETESTEAN